MKIFSLLLFGLLMSALSFSQQSFWTFETEQSASRQTTPPLIVPKIYKTLKLSFDQYKSYLNTAPLEAWGNIKRGIEISLPYPDHTFKRFKIVETKIMEVALAKRFPNIKTYCGQGIDDPSATVRIDYTDQGFHAMVISPFGSLYIDPYKKSDNNLYITYLSKDYTNTAKEKFRCKLTDALSRNALVSVVNAPLSGTCIGTQLRTYRLALSCTGEYAVAVCPVGNVTIGNTLSAMVTSMNRVNGVYQTEVDVKMVIIGINNSIIYTNAATDPYTGNDDPNTLLNESQSNITTVVGSSNFDIGHTFSTGAGGLASVGVACSNGSKAQGVTGLSNPIGDAYDIDYVAHEMGHQIGATHSFESELSNCGGGNRNKLAAYEPGSGTSIMGYAGICGTDNLQVNSDAWFHTKSFDQIVAYTTAGFGSTCGTTSTTANTPPVVNMPTSGLKIPKGTPFTLTGSATDVDGDALTYSWEEWDITNADNGSEWNTGDVSATAPLFKSRIPKANPSRTFPDISVILANYPASPAATVGGLKGEILPQVARDIKFRFTVRDNKATGGGVSTGGNGCSSTALFKVVVTNDGPFKITFPNSSVNWLGGSSHTISWNVSNTNDVNGINVQTVDILMSIDTGKTYPTIVQSGIPNNGTTTITVPNIPTNNAVRYMVKASGNIFFDINNANTTITFNSVLPVSLSQFSAVAATQSIVLSWVTVTEFNSQGFEIYRSEGTDNNFVKIGTVPVQGNTNTVNTYEFTDNTVKKGVLYFYRLRQIDINTNGFFSETRQAKIDSGDVFTVVIKPQPFVSTASLFLDGIAPKDFSIVVSDMLGRFINKIEIKNTQSSRLIPVDLSRQFRGIYFIKIQQDKMAKTVKAVKM